MIEKQLSYLKENRKMLAKKYSGKYIIISEELAISAFDTLEDAYNFGEKEYGLGNFLLQDCHPDYIGKVKIISPSIVFA